MERVEFEFRLKDLFTSSIKKAEQAGKKAYDTLDKESDEFNRKVKQNKQSVDGLSSGLSSLKGLATRVFAGIAIGQTIKSMADLSIEAEQNTIAFTTFLGSAEAAKESLAGLKQFASVTPFSSRQVIDVSKALLGFGVTADKLQPTLKALGDVSSGTGKDFKELAVIYGQIRSVGKLMGGDLMQLRQAGVPIVAELAKNLNKTEAEISGLVSKGKVGFKDVEKAFQTMSSEGGMFFNLMEKQSQSLGGRISTLVDNFEVIGTQIGDKVIAPVLGKLVQFSNEFLGNLDPIKQAFSALWNAFKPIGEGINQMGIAFGFWSAEGLNGATVAQNLANIIQSYLVPVVQFAANAFRSLAEFVSRNSEIVIGLAYITAGVYAFLKAFALVKGVIAIIQAVRTAFFALNAVMAANPIGLIVVAIGALVGAFMYAWNNIDGFKESILAFWDAAKYAFQNLGTFVPKVLSNIAKFFQETFQPFFEAIDAFKNGDYGKAAKLAGQGLLKTVTIPHRLVASAFTGELFEGTGADEVFKKSKEQLLREKREKEQKEAFAKLTKKLDEGNKPTSPVMPKAAAPDGSASSGLSETASRVGHAPQSITIEFKPQVDVRYDVKGTADSMQNLKDEFAKLLADMANMTTRAVRG